MVEDNDIMKSPQTMADDALALAMKEQQTEKQYDEGSNKRKKNTDDDLIRNLHDECVHGEQCSTRSIENAEDVEAMSQIGDFYGCGDDQKNVNYTESSKNFVKSKQKNSLINPKRAKEKRDDAEQKLNDIWKEISESVMESIENKEDELIPSTHNEEDVKALEEAINTTSALLHEEVESLVSKGLDAFQQADTSYNEMKKMKDILDIKERELIRLQESDEQNRKAISNMLKALEASKSNTMKEVREIQNETKLKTIVSNLRHDLSQVQSQSTEYKHEIILLQEQNNLLQSKISRSQQERRSMERDSRATLSLVRSMDNHVTLDTQFYKNKAKDLSDRLQEQQVMFLEQKGELEKLKRFIERGMSQNELERYRNRMV